MSPGGTAGVPEPVGKSGNSSAAPGDRVPENGTLYLCATPIGNLADITLRVLETLREVRLVAAEDTRRTRKLFSRYGISTPMISYREENREKAGSTVISTLEEGNDVALVSDAGTPGISDPGSHLLCACLDRGLKVEVLPGPSAVVTALVASGLPAGRFAFEGFLPRKQGPRARALKALKNETRTMVFFEAPSRVKGMLGAILEQLGDRRIALARELTKKFEQVLRGNVSSLLEELECTAPRGEYVIVVEGSTRSECLSPEQALEAVDALLREGMSLKDATGRLAGPGTGLSRRELYDAAVKRQRET